MKKESIIRKLLNRTSFKSQLFVIILVSFIMFELIAYLAITLTLSSIYTKNKLDDDIDMAISLSKDINREEQSFIKTLYSYKLKSENSILVLNNKTGGYLLEDYESYSYIITSVNDVSYIIPSLEVEINVGDELQLSYKNESGINDKIIRKIKRNNEIIYEEPYIELNTDSIVVKSIVIPKNLNYYYTNSNITTDSINIIDNKYNEFVDVQSSEGNIRYYSDKDKGYSYILVKPNNIDNVANEGSVIYIVAPFVETKTLINTTSITFIFIVLISLGVVALIAMFISNAFSRPIKIFEKEMLKLKENNYLRSNHQFRNKEMISLENTLNEVKKSISVAVESIKKQSKKLEKLNKELMNEEELRESFVQRLSHELKTPLMIISATTEALESGLIEKNDEKQSYETILNEVDKTTEIIKEIINNYKNSSEKLSLIKENFNLNELVDEVIVSLKPIATSNELTIIQNLDNVCYMNANKNMIKNVVSNFITNAIKYTPKNNNIEINIKEDETSFTFEVLNYGAHIDDKNLEKIWLPFFREKEDVDSSSTGMGLYIVKTTLESHKLEYDVCNFEKGVRSYFIIKK